jgi:hypothetical protein
MVNPIHGLNAQSPALQVRKLDASINALLALIFGIDLGRLA